MAGYDGPTGVGTPNGVAAFGPTVGSTDFSISGPDRGRVVAGQTKTVSFSTTTTFGSPESVSLSVRGAPPGATASFSPTTITSGDSSTLSIRTSGSTVPGTYTLPITATGTSRTHFGIYKLTVPCESGGQKLLNRGFETGTTGWGEVASHGIGIWSPREPPHSGSWDAWLGGTGTAHFDQLVQDVTIPSGCTSNVLSFWLHVDTAETTTTAKHDKLMVFINSTNGSKNLKTFSNLDAESGYTRHAFNVAQFAGQNVDLEFFVTENAGRQTSFVIEDAELRVK
jgi:hypothetical protein